METKPLNERFTNAVKTGSTSDDIFNNIFDLLDDIFMETKHENENLTVLFEVENFEAFNEVTGFEVTETGLGDMATFRAYIPKSLASTETEALEVLKQFYDTVKLR